MAAAVTKLQSDQSQLEPLIEAKVMMAAETTAQHLATLNGKFDELGRQLLQQVSSTRTCR